MCAANLAGMVDELRRQHVRAVELGRGAGLFDASTAPPQLREEAFAGTDTAVLIVATDDYVAAVDEALAIAARSIAKRAFDIRLVAGTFFSVVIALLLTQGLFVFRPAVRSVGAHIDAINDARKKLEVALQHVKQLQGLLPICMYCKRIRDAHQDWQRLESYLNEHAGVEFSHGICVECFAKHYPESP